jgi:hypothetical protein
MIEVSKHTIGGDLTAATELLHLSQSCTDVSTLIYTVSENAGALCERYVRAEQSLAQEASEVAEKCIAALKAKKQ